MDSKTGILLFGLLVLALVVFLLWFFIFKVKHLKTPDVFMVDGGVKTGKSLVTVMLAVKQYRRNCFKVRVVNFFKRIFNAIREVKNVRRAYLKKPLKHFFKYNEMPMLYSNMPLFNVKYNVLTMDVLLWNVRIPHKSVVIIDEATLLADSMLGMVGNKEKREKFEETNEVLTLFLKTFGHQTHGGACFYNSQQVVDLHFAFKRCTSTYLFVAKNRKFPFFCLLDVRELVHDESGDVINTIEKDVDVDNRPLFVSKRWYKYYNRFYLDVLTKNLPKYVDYDVPKLSYKDKKDLDKILTLGTYRKVHEYNERTR